MQINKNHNTQPAFRGNFESVFPQLNRAAKEGFNVKLDSESVQGILGDLTKEPDPNKQKLLSKAHRIFSRNRSVPIANEFIHPGENIRFVYVTDPRTGETAGIAAKHLDIVPPKKDSQVDTYI